MLEKISVIIPCFNEEKTIFQNTKKIASYLQAKNFSFELILVNDGSTDKTLIEMEKIKQALPIRIISHEINRGKGYTVKAGIMEAQGEISMFLDADLAIPIEELEKFLKEIADGHDLVIASRFVPGLKIIQPVLWYRKIMEQIFRFLRMAILNCWKVKDTQCGFKVFKTTVAKKIFSMSAIERFAFDSEIIFIAKKFGYSVKELPITLQNPRVSHVRIFRDSLNMFFALIKIRLNDLEGIYRWK